MIEEGLIKVYIIYKIKEGTGIQIKERKGGKE